MGLFVRPRPRVAGFTSCRRDRVVASRRATYTGQQQTFGFATMAGLRKPARQPMTFALPRAYAAVARARRSQRLREKDTLVSVHYSGPTSYAMTVKQHAAH